MHVCMFVKSFNSVSCSKDTSEKISNKIKSTHHDGGYDGAEHNPLERVDIHPAAVTKLSLRQWWLQAERERFVSSIKAVKKMKTLYSDEVNAGRRTCLCETSRGLRISVTRNIS